MCCFAPLAESEASLHRESGGGTQGVSPVCTVRLPALVGRNIRVCICARAKEMEARDMLRNACMLYTLLVTVWLDLVPVAALAAAFLVSRASVIVGVS